jgi:hypothetical protein
MQVLCAGALPASGLIGVEELLDMPTFGIVVGERLDFLTVGGAQKSFEGPLLRLLAQPLNQLIEGAALALDRGVALFRGGVSSPLPGALFGRDGLKTFLQ